MTRELLESCAVSDICYWLACKEWAEAHPDIVKKCKSVAELRARFEMGDPRD